MKVLFRGGIDSAYTQISTNYFYKEQSFEVLYISTVNVKEV
jgi:hypothetical protein